MEPKFLFIFTSPYSGSTAIANLLNTSSDSMFLHPKGEGSWLIKSMGGEERWNPKTRVNYKNVKRIWLKKFNDINNLVGNTKVVIEKSPSNIVRYEKIIQTFPNSSYFVLNRDPYSNCSSMLHRLFDEKELKDKSFRDIQIKKLVKFWLFRSRILKQIIDQKKALNFTYEYFCANTKYCISEIQRICPELSKVRIRSKLKVKDYPPQKLENQNEKQLRKLSKSDISNISQILSRHEALLNYFDYEIL